MVPILIAILVIGIWAISNRNVQQQIGLIDIDRILNESTGAARFNEQVREKYDQLIVELQREPYMDEQAQAEYERAVYAEYLRVRQELEDEFQKILDQAISEIATIKGLHLVLDEDLVRYGGQDISGEVIKRLK